MKTKLTLFIVVSGIFFSITPGYAQSDTSLKFQRTYKNNIKTQPLLFLPVISTELSYERALSKKTSLSLTFSYSTIYGRYRYDVLPAFAYYLSKHKKNKYNRGLYLKAAALTYYVVPGEYYKYKNVRAYLMGGVGYQWIIGPRVAVNVSALSGMALYNKYKSTDADSGDTDWHKPNYTRILIYPQIGIGYTF